MQPFASYKNRVDFCASPASYKNQVNFCASYKNQVSFCVSHKNRVDFCKVATKTKSIFRLGSRKSTHQKSYNFETNSTPYLISKKYLLHQTWLPYNRRLSTDHRIQILNQLLTYSNPLLYYYKANLMTLSFFCLVISTYQVAMMVMAWLILLLSMAIH